jgi:cell division protein FtsZ
MSDTILQTNNQINSTSIHRPVLKVLGLGGGGGNAVTRMLELGVGGVEFIAANTDLQVLKTNPSPRKILMGPHVTRGLGAGGDPRLGKAAAEESAKEIAAALSGADMVFLTAGMGGGTGTGSIPVAAEIARKLGAVTIAIVTMPFAFEMGRRQQNAAQGLALLQKQTDTLISIPNDRLLYVAPRNLPMEMAFRLADDVLRQAVQGISELITEPGLINVDFSHIRRLMKLGGGALMAIGHGQGENKANKAIEQALHHPMLDSVALDHAAGIIANFTGGTDLTLFEVEEALTRLQEQTSAQTEIVLGVINDERMEERVQVTLIVTGLGAPTLEETLSKVNQPKPIEIKSDPLPVEPPARPVATPTQPAQPLPPPANAADIDLPAFLRRRIRYAG